MTVFYSKWNGQKMEHLDFTAGGQLANCERIFFFSFSSFFLCFHLLCWIFAVILVASCLMIFYVLSLDA